MRRLVCLASVALVLLSACGSTALAGTVEGTVTPVEWAQEVEVCVIIRGVVSEQCAVPEADGSYAYPGILGTVTFEFIPTDRSGLLPQFYDHKKASVEATYINVGPDVVEGINANLLEGGRITGVVTSRVGGAGLAEVEVCAIPLPPLASKSCDETNASGEYSLRSLPSGLDRVGF